MHNLLIVINTVDDIALGRIDKQPFIAYDGSVDRQFVKINHLLVRTDEPKTRVSSLFVYNSSDHCSSQEESCSALVGKQRAMYSDRATKESNQ